MIFSRSIKLKNGMQNDKRHLKISRRRLVENRHLASLVTQSLMRYAQMLPTLLFVLMHEGHLIAYKSQKIILRITTMYKRKIDNHPWLRVWLHYILGSWFIIMTDNITTCYLQTKKKLNQKQARWSDFLVEFNYIMEYKLGRAKMVANALSQRAKLASISQASSYWL